MTYISLDPTDSRARPRPGGVGGSTTREGGTIREVTPALVRQTAEDFVGNERFLVQRRLGSGAFGVVYEAFDRQENSLVALKVLRFAEADALYRFKKGFRSLADIRHPNLVSFYELFTEGGVWFFSMELVPGMDFIEYLTGMKLEDGLPSTEIGSDVASDIASDIASEIASDIASPGELAAGSPGSSASAIPWEVSEVEDPTPPRSAARVGAVDAGKIRRTLLQLAQGLHALHRHGKVHRDIKPTNVEVTAEGRVVLLDFGLVAELAHLDGPQAANPQLVGTPAYMSPESALALPGSPAGDWYGVGVMLFQALTGRLPFEGSLAEIFSSKQVGPPPSPAEWVPDLPEDLDLLCRGLLDPDPETRLSGEQVIRCLLAPGTALAARTLAPVAQETPFVGRQEVLETLVETLDTSCRQAAVVYLQGASGMGKSALLDRFVLRVREHDPRAVVLAGRCYLQESVPYKALDSLVDSLSRYLTTLEPSQVEVLLPARLASLVRLFPVLSRVEAISSLELRDDGPQEPKSLRRRGFDALRELLTRLAARRSLVLMIDDLQWGDLDSFYVLDELFGSPDPPPLLLIVSYRSEDIRSSAILRALGEQRENHRWRSTLEREITLGPLAHDEVRRLVEDLGTEPSALAEAVEELGGNPLFLTELAHWTRHQDTPELGGVGETLHLRDLILARLEGLSAAARRLLEVVAVAGKPVDLEAARRAAELSSGASEALAQLRGRKLVRQRSGDGHGEIESYHDRIRETVCGELSNKAMRDIHGHLARALEAVGRTDAETLAVHFQATEQLEQARRYVIAAAGRAERALAFDRAARLYRLALELLSVDSAERYELRVKLGSALASSGHSREAADTFIEAVGDSGTINPLDVQRHAAEKLLISGHIDRGLAVLRHVLRHLDMGLERKPWRSLLQLAWHRLRLRLRGLDFDERQEIEVGPELLQRIDVCWSVEIGLCLVDVLHASEFHARHLLLALGAGEPQRIARGLAMEVFFGAMEGRDGSRILELARQLAGRVPGRYAASLTEMAAGMLACSEGDWRVADRRLSRAREHLRDSRGGVVWELDTVQHFQVVARLQLGRWRELFDDAPRQLERAAEQGDLYLEIHWLYWVESLRLIAADRAEEARELVLGTAGRWSYEGFHYQHFGHLWAETQIALYQGRIREAEEQMEDRWRALEGSRVQRIGMVRVQSWDLRGRTALALALTTDDTRERHRLLVRVERCARQLERVGSSWALALASQLRAGVASFDGDPNRVRQQLEIAIAGFDACSMVIHGLFARWHRAALEGGESPGSVAARRALEDLGIAKPGRMARVSSPGSWDLAAPP